MVDFVCGPCEGLDKLREVVGILRSPEGCPWDREQTHTSLRGALIEEAYEAADAIDSGHDGELREELGDLLLQIVFHAALAEEAGRFALDEVIGGVCQKLVRRHPHVFGDTAAGDTGQVLRNWDAIKREEKAQETPADALRAIPRSFPALLRADKLVSRAERAGYKEPAAQAGQAGQPAGEARALTEDEIGEALFQTVLRSHSAGIDPEMALQKRLERFIGSLAEP
jgi:tetrapyrrole methylase family protein/MazG family protein